MKYQIEFNMPTRKPRERGQPIDWMGIEMVDGGQTIMYQPGEESFGTVEEGGDGMFFVRLVSYDEFHRENQPEFMTDAHPLFGQFEGQRVRITVEVVE